MSYSEILAVQVEKLLNHHPGFSKKKMFGGMCYLLNGNMCCGIVQEKLMLRIGPQMYLGALNEPHITPMDFTGRPMKGMVYLVPPGANDSELQKYWVDLAAHFALSLPLKNGA